MGPPLFIMLGAGVLLFCVAPIIMGFIALGRVDANSPPRSRGFALAAIAMGVVWLFALPVVLVFWMTSPSVTRTTVSWGGGAGGAGGNGGVITISPPQTPTVNYSRSRTGVAVLPAAPPAPMSDAEVDGFIELHNFMLQNLDGQPPAVGAKKLSSARDMRVKEPRLPAAVAAAMKAEEDRAQVVVDRKAKEYAEAAAIKNAGRPPEYNNAIDQSLKAINAKDVQKARFYLTVARGVREQGATGYTAATLAEFKRIEDNIQGTLRTLEESLKIEKARGGGTVGETNPFEDGPELPAPKAVPAPPPAEPKAVQKAKGSVGETDPFDDGPKVPAPKTAPAATPKEPAKTKATSVGEQDPF